MAKKRKLRPEEQPLEPLRLVKPVKKPWGKYLVLTEGKEFKVKLLEVKPGKSLSLQKHKFRDEHWIVVEGRAKVIKRHRGSKHHRELNSLHLLSPNQDVIVPATWLHKLSNPGDKPLKVIEVQYGSYLGEDDIERVKEGVDDESEARA